MAPDMGHWPVSEPRQVEEVPQRHVRGASQASRCQVEDILHPDPLSDTCCQYQVGVRGHSENTRRSAGHLEVASAFSAFPAAFPPATRTQCPVSVPAARRVLRSGGTTLHPLHLADYVGHRTGPVGSLRFLFRRSSSSGINIPRPSVTVGRPSWATVPVSSVIMQMSSSDSVLVR
ncbi:hypothetical protein J6590_023598 [Homalodisca vitripennis]|nr:hypothetical protein J6590_023598 [Homalodisca vitripennis]